MVDVAVGGDHLTEAIMISIVFFYIILYSHDNRLDPLTGLLNRQAFYDDCKLSGKSVRAVASLDMNGLKELNDTQGHKAGTSSCFCYSMMIRRSLLPWKDGSKIM